MKKLTLKRWVKGDNKRGVIGEIISQEGNQLCVTLELPDLNNKKDISCIPIGTYECFQRISTKNNQRIDGIVYELKGVPNRENVQIHIGNFLSNTEGCILVGRSTDLHVIMQSTEAMQDLIKYCGKDNFLLEVKYV